MTSERDPSREHAASELEPLTDHHEIPVSTEIEDDMSRAAHETWRSLTGPSGYLPVLLLLIAVTLAAPLFGDVIVGTFLTAVLSALTVLFAVVRSTNRPKLRRTARIVVAALLAGSFIAGYIHHQRSTGVTTGTPDIRWAQATFLVLYLILLLLALPLLLVRAFAHRRVSINTVCATISGYLLIGLIFTTLYRLIGVFSPMFVQNPDPSLGDYSYFSFITLTTTGFGDLTARTDPQKAVVMLEALMGQIFMVTAVARVVSLLGSTRPDAEQLEARLQDD